LKDNNNFVSAQHNNILFTLLAISYSHQTIIRPSSGHHHAIITPSSGHRQAIIRPSIHNI
jgi:hypothetical protein